MKKRDLEKLRDAFEIPEPEHKSEFIAEHGEKFIKKKSGRRRPLILRYAPTVAFAVMLIGLWGVIKPDGSLKEKPGGDNVIIETSDEKTSVITTFAEDQYRSETAVTTTASRTEKKPGTTVTAISAEVSHSHGNESQPIAIEAPTPEPELPAVTEAAETTTVSVPRRTSAGNNSAPVTSVTETTAKKTSSAAGTSATATATTTRKPNTTSSSSKHEVDHVVVTTVSSTTPNDEDDGNNMAASDGNGDVNLTVAPDPVYKKTDKIYEIKYGCIPGTDAVDITDNIDAECDLVVNGCVTDIFYTRAKNMPYTQINILITDLLTNTEQLSIGCMISVYIPGGYMPSDEYFAIYPDKRPYDGDYTVYDSAGICELPEQGDIYSFFLKKGGDGIPEGAYVLASESPASMYKI